MEGHHTHWHRHHGRMLSVEDALERILDHFAPLEVEEKPLLDALGQTLAEDVARHCLAHPRAARVTVSIEKLDKDPGAVGVEVVRSKREA